MSGKGSFKVKTSKRSPRRRKWIKRTNGRSITKHTKKIQIGGALTVDNIINSSKPGNQPLKFTAGSLNEDLPDFNETLKKDTLVKVKDNSVDKIFKYERVKQGKTKSTDTNVYVFQHNGFIPFPNTVVATVYQIVKDTDKKIKGYKLLLQETESNVDGLEANNLDTANAPKPKKVGGKDCVYRTEIKVGNTAPDQEHAYLLFRRSKQNEKGEDGNIYGIYQYWGEQEGKWDWINAV